MSESNRLVRSWVELPRKHSTQRQRRNVLRNFVMANNSLPENGVPDTHRGNEEKTRVWEGIYQAVDKGISALRDNPDSIVASINNLVIYMDKKGSSGTGLRANQLLHIQIPSNYPLDDTGMARTSFG